jgi:hypothetical protein
VSDLKALHEAAMEAGFGTKAMSDWAEATLADYADGTLVERTPVGGERMSEHSRVLSEIIAQVAAVPWQSQPVEANVYRDDRRWCIHLWHDGVSHDVFIPLATSLERKPLDGYDWRAWRCACGDGVPDEMAAYIEALEAKA